MAGIEEIKKYFSSLNRRERTVLAAGGFFLLCFLLVWFVVLPYRAASSSLDRHLVSKKSEYVDLQLLQQEYREMKKQAGGIKDRLARRSPSFSLFSFLDSKASEAGVKENISYMKPSVSQMEGELQESLVEMKLVNIPLAKIVEYLKLIESPADVVSIKRISIQQNSRDEGQLDVILQILTFTGGEG